MEHPPPQDNAERQLITDAVGGDAIATQAVLLRYRSLVVQYVRERLPAPLQAVCDPEDVVQDVMILAYRAISKFQLGPPGTFAAWMKTIARARMVNLLAEHTTLKRGGGGKLQHLADRGDDRDVVQMLEMLAVYRRTPSQSAAAHELARALERSIDQLPSDSGIAIRLRHVEGLDAKSAAARMSRSEGAFHQLCNRGYKRLRELLVSESRYA